MSPVTPMAPPSPSLAPRNLEEEIIKPVAVQANNDVSSIGSVNGMPNTPRYQPHTVTDDFMTHQIVRSSHFRDQFAFATQRLLIDTYLNEKTPYHMFLRLVWMLDNQLSLSAIFTLLTELRNSCDKQFSLYYLYHLAQRAVESRLIELNHNGRLHRVGMPVGRDSQKAGLQ